MIEDTFTNALVAAFRAAGVSLQSLDEIVHQATALDKQIGELYAQVNHLTQQVEGLIAQANNAHRVALIREDMEAGR